MGRGRRKGVRGTVYQLADGRWRAQLTIAGVRESLGVYGSEAMARAVLDECIKGTEAVQAGNTLATYGARWLDRRELAGRVRHVDKERDRWRRHIADAPFAALPMRAIKRRHIAQWIETLLAGRKRQTVVNVLSLLRACLRSALDEGHLNANPAADLHVPRTAPEDPAWAWLTQDEIDAVVACDAVPRDRRLLYVVAIYTGLRASELWRLAWQRVHLTGHPRVEVRAPAKTKAAIRDVPLLDPAADAFEELRAARKVRRIGRPDLVWPRADGEARTVWDGDWAEHRERRGGELQVRRRSVPDLAGIGRQVRFHDLRHTCASHLLQGTWTPEPLRLEEVQQWLGHSSIGVTQRYAHLRPGSVLERVTRPRKKPHNDRTPHTTNGTGDDD